MIQQFTGLMTIAFIFIIAFLNEDKIAAFEQKIFRRIHKRK